MLNFAVSKPGFRVSWALGNPGYAPGYNDQNNQDSKVTLPDEVANIKAVSRHVIMGSDNGLPRPCKNKS